MLKLSFLGRFQVELDNQRVTGFRTSKVQGLLVYLVQHPGVKLSRLVLATLLWPDSSEKAALQNLRTTLYRLRKTLQDRNRPQPFISSGRNHITWNGTGVFEVDVACFQSHVAAVEPLPKPAQLSDPVALRHVKMAAPLYRGEFLQGINVESALFEQWLHSQREQLHEQAMWVFNLAAEQAERSGEYDKMRQYARLQLQYEPWREEAYQQLMRAHFEQRQYGKALEQYRICLEMLKLHLNLEPAITTRQFYEKIYARYLEPLPLKENPYRGLDVFLEADANYFFGREAFAAQVIQAVRQQSWAAIIGASGSGKSSVVHAGVLPQLRYLNHWHMIEMRPGERPLRTFADTLRLEKQDLEPSHYITALHEIRQPILLVIDAFEELYTLCTDPICRHKFIDLLIHIQRHTELDLTVLLTMRADFMGQATAYRPLADVIQIGTFILGPMNESEMRRAIEEPAIVQRVKYESGLVGRLVRDAGAEIGGLPLLEFALTLLWEKQDNGRLTHEAYEEIGQIHGALVQHADSFLAHLSSDDQDRVRRLLLKMIHLGEQTDDTRRQVSQTEISDENWHLVQKLADARLVVTSRNTRDQEVAEIAHETLIRQWPMLRRWMNADRLFHTWQQRIQSLRKHWQYSHEDNGDLLRGNTLNEAKEWLTTRHEDIEPINRVFIEASLALRQREEAEKKAQQQREITQSQALAEAERLRAEEATEHNLRLQRQVDISQSLSLATNSRLALVENNRDLALSLAVEANKILNPPEQARHMLNETALRTGTRHILRGHSAAVQDVVVSKNGRFALSASSDNSLIGWNLIDGSPVGHFVGHQDAVLRVALLGEDTQALSLSADRSLKRWDLATEYCLQTIEIGHEILAFAITPDEQQVWLGCADGNLRVWNLHTNEQVAELSGHQNPVLTVAISPNGKTAVSGGIDCDVVVWNTADFTSAWRLEAQHDYVESIVKHTGHNSEITGIHFAQDDNTFLTCSRLHSLATWDSTTQENLWWHDLGQDLLASDWMKNGRYAVVGTLDGRVWVIDPWLNTQCYDLLGHTGRVHCVRFTPNGRQVVSGSHDGTLRVWDLHHGQEIRSLNLGPKVERKAFTIALSPDGKTGLLGEISGDIAVFDYASGHILNRLKGHIEPVFSGVHFVDDGKTAVSAAADVFSPIPKDKSVCVWNYKTGQLLTQFNPHADKIWQIKVSPDKQWIASACHDGKIHLWHITQKQMNLVHDFSPHAARSLAFSPDGTHLAVGVAKGTSATPNYAIRILSIATGEVIQHLEGHQEVVTNLEFTPDGSLLVSSGIDKEIIVWNMQTKQLLHRLREHTKGILSVSIHPDGVLAATAGYDNEIILWHLPTGHLLRRFSGHHSIIMQILFHPNGKTLLSVSADNTMREWQIDESSQVSSSWIKDNRTVLPLTSQQKKKYLI